MIGPMQLLPRLRIPLLALLVLLWALAVTATHVPPRAVPDMGVSDKTEHIVGFLGLAGIFIVTLTAWGVSLPARVTLTMFIMPIYAALDEWTQPPFGRDCDIYDWTADLTGTLTAILVWAAFLALWQRTSKRGPATLLIK